MKKWKKITVEEGLMKDIQSIIGSNESKSGFATAAIEKELKRIKKERAELDIQELADEFRNNAVLYSKKGIKSLSDYASQLKTVSKDVNAMKKDLIKLKLDRDSSKRITQQALMGKFGMSLPEAKKLKKIIKEGKLKQAVKKMKKNYELELEKQASKIIADPKLTEKLLEKIKRSEEYI